MAHLHVFPDDKTAFVVEDCGRVANVTDNTGSSTHPETTVWSQHPDRGREHLAELRKMWDARLAAALKVGA